MKTLTINLLIVSFPATLTDADLTLNMKRHTCARPYDLMVGWVMRILKWIQAPPSSRSSLVATPWNNEPGLEVPEQAPARQ